MCEMSVFCTDGVGDRGVEFQSSRVRAVRWAPHPFVSGGTVNREGEGVQKGF